MATGHRLFGALLAAGFLLGIHDGCVALWKDDDPAPAYVSDYPASALPEMDQQALAAGIYAPDPATASAMLEDFSS